LSVLANPEFLRTGRAIEDFLRPSRVVIGRTEETTQDSLDRIATLYATLEAPLVVVDAESAELVKNASNAFLAMRVSFVNELAALCDVTGANVDDVVAGMAYDPRIGGQFMRPGLGYGGSCLPKDVRSLMSMGRDHGLGMPLVQAIDRVNVEQVTAIADRLGDRLGKSFADARIAILGLAFKAETDDIRESASIALALEIQRRGASVVACDPHAAARVSTALPDVQIAEGPLEAATAADAVVLATEWPEYVTLDLRGLASVMRGDLLLDGRNALDPEGAKAAGFRYVGVGRAGGQIRSEAAA